MEEDLANLLIVLGFCALVCDVLWGLVSWLLSPWNHRPGLWTNRGDGMPHFRTHKPGRITLHRNGTITVEEVETTPRHLSNGG